jgi:hypothetical protein
MKDLFDKLKDAGRDALGTFVVLDEDGNEVEAPRGTPGARPATQSPAGAAPAASAAPASAPIPGAVAAATVDPEFVQGLQAACQASKKTAYTQFQTLYSALGAIADPAQRAQLALSAAQASHGVTPQQVAEAIEDRMALLAAERTAFEKAVQAETDHSIDAAKAEIAKKADEIRQLEATRVELERGIAEARATIDGNSARFAASYAVVEAELAAERARIAAFITPNPK